VINPNLLVGAPCLEKVGDQEFTTKNTNGGKRL